MKQLTISRRLLLAFAISAIALANGSRNAHAQSCAAFIDHESRTAGEAWFVTGEFMFTEDGISVFTNVYTDGGGSRMMGCSIGPSPRPIFGAGLVQLYDQACTLYNIRALGLAVSQVRFSALNLNQLVNLGVNGYAPLILPLDALDGASPAPGVRVAAAVTTLPDGSSMAEVTVMGSVQTLVFGGSNAALDNLCVIGNEMPPWECDVMADHESLMVGAVWGDEPHETPGMLAFVEDGIEARLLEYTAGGGLPPDRFGSASVDAAVLPALSDRHLKLERISIAYSVAGLERHVRQVTINFVEPTPGLHREVLGINGIDYEGQLSDFGSLAVPGMTVTVSTARGDGLNWGVIRIIGDAQVVTLGGGDLRVDNVCFMLGAVAATPGDARLSLASSVAVYPNPCNPQTEIRFQAAAGARIQVSIHDLAGRRLRSLIAGSMSDGAPSAVTWNGRDDAGHEVAAGVYIARIQADGQVATGRIALIK